MSENDYPTRQTIDSFVEELLENSFIRGKFYTLEELDEILKTARNMYLDKAVEEIHKEISNEHD